MTVVNWIVTYPVRFVAPGARTRQEALVWQEFPFEVREVAARQAPVGVTTSFGDEKSVWRLNEEGRLHRRLLNRHRYKAIPLEELKFREIVSHERERAQAATQSLLDSAFLLGKEVFVPTPGPFVRFPAKSFDTRSWKSLTHLAPGPAEVDAFSFGVEDDLEGWAARINASGRYRLNEADVLKGVAEFRDRTKVHVPGCTDSEAIADLALVGTAAKVFETDLTNRMIGSYTAAHLRGWARYHAGTVDKATPNPDLADIVLAAGRSRHEIQRGDEADDRLKELLFDAEIAGWRWEERPRPTPSPA